MHLIEESTLADRTREVHLLLDALYSAANNPFTGFFLHEVQHRLLTHHALSTPTMTTGCAVLSFAKSSSVGTCAGLGKGMDTVLVALAIKM